MEKEADRQAPTQMELVMRARRRLRHQTNPNELLRQQRKTPTQFVQFCLKHEVPDDKRIPEEAEDENGTVQSVKSSGSIKLFRMDSLTLGTERPVEPININDLKIYGTNEHRQPEQHQAVRSERLLKRTPYSISDLLYLQGCKDVNPYLETLKELRNCSEEWSDRNRIEQLCYIGIGRSVVQVKKRSKPPYSRVNILIRQFMMEVMEEEVERKSESHPETIFVMCCKHSLGFRPALEDQRLRKYISDEEYRRNILAINSIIERNFLNFKRKKPQEMTMYNRYSLATSGLGVVLLILSLIFGETPALMAVSWSLLGLALLINVVGVFRSHNSLHDSQSIITTIHNEITKELGNSNTRNPSLEWCCGTDFYWLEITPQYQQNQQHSEILQTQQQLN